MVDITAIIESELLRQVDPWKVFWLHFEHQAMAFRVFPSPLQ